MEQKFFSSFETIIIVWVFFLIPIFFSVGILILIQTNFSKEGMLTSLFPFGISSLVLLVIFFLLRMVNIAGEPHGGKRGKKY
jgi:hypothetical protein